MPSDIPFELEEMYALENAFRKFMKVYVRLVMKRMYPRVKEWPAMQVDGCLAKFIYRNHGYARPTNDPIYRK